MTIDVVGLSKAFDGDQALDSVSLHVERGEILVVLGPSGSGKSTLLNVVAGLLQADSGEVKLNGRDCRGVETHDRDLAYVMAGLGLYEHLSVARNIAFPLAIRGLDSAAIARRVTSLATLFGLQPVLERMPMTLSSGQRQRTAVARALARTDTVALLADECFSALDAQTRYVLRGQLRRVLVERQIPCLFVTHDQAEGMALGMRVAIMRDGRVVQTAHPGVIYDDPAELFVAEFIARPVLNKFDHTSTHVRQLLQATQQGYDNTYALRPEDIQVCDACCIDGLPARAVAVEVDGSETVVRFEVQYSQGGEITARTKRGAISLGAAARLRALPGSGWQFSKSTGIRLRAPECE